MTMPARARRRWVAGLVLTGFAVVSLSGAAQHLASLAERNGSLPGPLPLFPVDNWWNLDISAAPVDARSSDFINFIGPTDGLHPDFGGLDPDVVNGIYGMPFVVVGADQPKVSVVFDYDEESDGVNHATGQSYPFYPVPAQAVTEPFWIEGGPAGNSGAGGDRHMLIGPWSMMLASGFSRESSDGYEKAVSVNGQPGFEKWDSDSKDGELNILVNKRFLVSIEGNDIADTKVLHDIAGKMDFAKFGALK